MGMLKNIPELKTPPIRDIIYERLRKAIIESELKAGDTFTDNEIAEEFGVSRTPIREAVQKLESEGYIKQVTMKGYQVCGFSPLELAHCFAMRKALESLAVRYTCIYIDEAGLAELNGLLGRIELAFTQQQGDKLVEEVIPLVKRYNEVVFNNCGSERLEELIWSTREIFDRYRVNRIVLPNHVELSLSRRRDLYNAFVARDPEKAAEVWSLHLEDSFRIWCEKSGHGAELKDFRFF